MIGDTVNVANRLQQATRALQCDLVVGQDLVHAVKIEDEQEHTINLLGRLRSHGEFAIRGRTQTVEVLTLTMTPTET